MIRRLTRMMRDVFSLSGLYIGLTTVGILAGLMWVPFSWMIQHWVGLFHGIARTVLVTAAWYLFPQRRFVAIPAVIVVIYLITIVVLARRPGPSPNERR